MRFIKKHKFTIATNDRQIMAHKLNFYIPMFSTPQSTHHYQMTQHKRRHCLCPAHYYAKKDITKMWHRIRNENVQSGKMLTCDHPGCTNVLSPSSFKTHGMYLCWHTSGHLAASDANFWMKMTHTHPGWC